jgi:pimeloyl-ACP methyl ester carboxylesterase
MNGQVMFSTSNGGGPGKPALLMVHGFTQTHAVFDRQAEAFADRFEVIRVDLRGHGGSAGLRGPYGIEEYTDDLEATVEALGVRRFALWGTHTGTAVGLLFALRHPGRLRALLCEGIVVPGLPMPRVAELIERARRLTEAEGLDRAREDWWERADWFAYMRAHPAEARAAAHREMVLEFEGAPWRSREVARPAAAVRAALPGLGVPLLVYNGAEDMPEFLGVAEHVAAAVPGVRRAVVPRAGAFAAWENPEDVNALAAGFLASCITP